MNLDRLIQEAQGLGEKDLSEVVDFIGYLKAKRSKDVEEEASRLEAASMTELSAHLADLERGLPEGHVEGWLADLARNAVPVRFNPESGELEEEAR